MTETDFDTLARAHADELLRYARRLCPTAADAEDAAQSTLLKLLLRSEPLTRTDTPRPWLFTVVRNHCLRLVKVAARFASMPDERVDPAALRLDDGALVSKLLHAISQLDEEQRDVLIRRDVLGESGKGVATALGLSLPAVKSRLHRARRTLLAALTRA